jgi:hypothetical protein
MTGKKFLLYILLNWLLLALLKVWFFNNQIFSSPGLQEIAFWIITPIISIALVRRFGLLSFLEALFIMFTWSVFIVVFDLLFTSNYIGVSSLYGRDYIFGLVIMNAGIFIFHKKRHLAVRQELHDRDHALKHGHAPGHEQEKKH